MLQAILQKLKDAYNALAAAGLPGKMAAALAALWAWTRVKAIAAWPLTSSYLRNAMDDAIVLRVYGDSLITNRINAEMKWIARVLMIELMVDTWAWWRAWQYGLPNSWLVPVMLGFAFGLATLAFARSVMVLDSEPEAVPEKVTLPVPFMRDANGGPVQYTFTKPKWFPFAGRAMVLILISLITSVPLELAVFETEITRRIENRQKIASDAIRDNAIKKETGNFDRLIEAAKKQLPLSAAGTKILSDTTEAYKAERRLMRKQAEDARRPEAETKQKAVETQRRVLNEEMQGKRTGSGRYGKGPAALGMQELLQAMEVDLREYNSETARQLTEFDAATEKGIREREQDVTAKTKTDASDSENAVRDLVEQKDKKLDELRVMAIEKVALKYGGDYKQTGGFMDRYRELSAMADEDASVWAITWGCTLVMLLLGLLDLALKINASKEMKRYYSSIAQMAVAAATDLAAHARVQGFTGDTVVLAWTAEIKNLNHILHAQRRVLASTVEQFNAQLISVASYKDAQGRSLTAEAARANLRKQWSTLITPAELAARGTEQDLRLLGASVPPWPKDLTNGVEPTANDETQWKLPEDDLRTYGWVDPTPQLRRPLLDMLTKARESLAEAFREFANERSELALYRDAKGLALTSARIHSVLRDSWRLGVTWSLSTEPWTTKHRNETAIPGLMAELSHVEQGLEVAGIPVPKWPGWLNEGTDPRTPSADRLCHPSVRELTDLGWEDPEPKLRVIRDAVRELNGNRRIVEQIIARYQDELQDAVVRARKDPFAKFQKMEPLRHMRWTDKIRPVLAQLTDLEQIIRDNGGEVPPWNPPASIDNCWKVTREQLWRLGWEGEERPKPPQPPNRPQTTAGGRPEGRSNTLPGFHKGTATPPPALDMTDDADEDDAEGEVLESADPATFVDRSVRSSTGPLTTAVRSALGGLAEPAPATAPLPRASRRTPPSRT